MFCVTESLTVGFKNYLISAEKSENTVEKYIRDLRHFAAFLKGEVTREKVLAYKKELCEDYAPASVNSMLSSLNAFFDFAGRIDLKVKTLKISRRIFTDIERELKKSEYEKILDYAVSIGIENAYIQEGGTAKESFIPEFNGEGAMPEPFKAGDENNEYGN